MRPAVRWLVLLAGLAILGAGSARAQSAGTTIAGPFTVTLPSAPTFSFSTSFRTPAPIQGSYVLRVQQSAASNLTAFSLSLNGTPVFALSDFTGGVTSVDRVATLLASNAIALQVAGARGTRITITVFTAVMPRPVSLSPNPLPLNIGASGTLTATLAPSPTAAGTLSVTSSDPGVAGVSSSVGFAAGQTSVAIPVAASAPGSTTVTASANGGQAGAAVNVNAPATVSITSPSTNSVFQAPATIAIAATAADADGVVAKVDFYQGEVLIGLAVSAPYTFSWSNVAPGSYSLSAVVTDNQGASTASSAVTVRVNAPPGIALTSPANGVSLVAPATVPLAAAASDSDGSIAKVDFFQGATFIGTATAAPYVFNWTNVGQGTYAVTAVATDNDGAMTTSAAVNLTVNSAAAQLYYIVPDHLNTPRVVQDQNANVVWTWDQREPFGATQPNPDPDGDGVAFDFALRFPGQYFDRETSLAHNYFRDYDLLNGRYVESDLVGLHAGLNTYAYVSGRPLTSADPLGLMGNAPGPSRPSPYCGTRPTAGCVPTPPPPEPTPLICDCENAFDTCMKLVDWYPFVTQISGALIGAGIGVGLGGRGAVAAGGGTAVGGASPKGIEGFTGMNQSTLNRGCEVGRARCLDRCPCEE